MSKTWAEQRLEELEELIVMNKKLLKEYPDKFSLKIALKSKLQHREELMAKIKAGE